MQKLIFLLFLIGSFLCFNQKAAAQENYKTAIGLRVGPNYGLTVKHFWKDKWAFEGLFSSRGFNNGRNGRGLGGFNITGLAEWHGTLPNAKGFAWYAGLGAHLGRWYGGNWGRNYNSDYYFVLGLDAIIGLEYTFASAPFNIAIDYKPEFDFVGYNGFWGDGIAVSLRLKLN